MQAWDIVKVNNEANEHYGRAGKVVSVDGDQVTVDLDETQTHESGEEVFAEADLQFLGR